MPPMANKNLDKCVLLLRQMMDRDSGSASSSGGKKLGLKKKSKRVSVLTTAARPKVKKKDTRLVVTTRKVFSKTKLNVDMAKKPRSKLTAAPETTAEDVCEVEELSHRPERDFHHGKASQLPDKPSEHISNGSLQPKSAIHFDKPFTALQPPRRCSQPLDDSTAPCVSQPASQSDAMQQSGVAPPFNQRLLSSTPAMTPVKVTRPVSAEVTGGDPLPLNSSDQVRAVRPPNPPPIIPRLFEGVIAFQPQPCGNMVTTSSRAEPLPPFVGQYAVSSTGQELVQPCEATGFDQPPRPTTNLVTAAWMDDFPVRDNMTAVTYVPPIQGQPCVYPLPYGQPGTYPAPSSVSMPGPTQFYPIPSCHGQMEQRLPQPGQNMTSQCHPNSTQPTYPMMYSVPLAQPETRPHPAVNSGVSYPITVLSRSQEEQPPSSTAVIDTGLSTGRPQDSKDITLSPPVKETATTATPVKGEFALYSDCGTAEASPVTHNPRSTSQASCCANSKRPPVRTRASESQKLASARMSAGVSARNAKSLDRDPKSSSRERERKKRPPKTKTKAFSDMVDAEVQVGTSGGTHQCDCDTATESSDHVTQVKVDEDMEKKCSTARSHLHTLSYLLKELKTVSGISGHSATGQDEIGRLVGEMEQTVSSLLPGVTTLSWQTEIDLAMLPLRSENAQLRRRVRILTQQLKEKTREVEEAQKPDPTFEVVQLQMTEHQLRKELAEERMAREKRMQEMTLLEEDFRQVTSQKQELLQVLTNKERAHQKAMEEARQELKELQAARETGQRKGETHLAQVEEATGRVASLEISLKERDRELSHMHSLVRSLQSNMTSLLSDFHGSRLQMSDLDRPQPHAEMHHPGTVSEATVGHRQERTDSLPATTTSDRDGQADSACYSRGSDSLTPSTRSRRELNFNVQQQQCHGGATANWAATIQQDNSPRHRRQDAHSGPCSPAKRDSVGNTPTRPLRTEDLQHLCGFSPQEGDSSMATDYMVPPGVSPMRKLPERGEREPPEAPSDAPTVKQMLVALAGRIQQQHMQDDHVTAAANHSSSTMYAESTEDTDSTLEANPAEEVAWKSQKSDVHNETRYSVTDYFSKYRQRNQPDATVSGANGAVSQRPIQQAAYRDTDTDLDTTLSSIPDLTQLADESFASSLASSVSSLASSASVDDQVFREGLNSLDATIAQIQQTIRQAMHRGQRAGNNQLTYVNR